MINSTKEFLLDEALKIGKRICRQAIWEKNGCTWEVVSATNGRSGGGTKVTASGNIYQGTSGIGLFLLELYKITKDSEILKVCSGAIKYSINDIIKHPATAFGFHSGRVGMLYAALEYANYFDDIQIKEQSKKYLEEMLGNEKYDRGIDIIGGAAGAIPGLLAIYNMSKYDVAVEIAFNLAEHLIKISQKEPAGWSWETIPSISVKNLCGYAHGNSGIGHAFLELYNLSSEEYYLYCAEQAFLYERKYYNDKQKNWPDFRNTDLFDYMHGDNTEKFKEDILSNKIRPYQLHYMNAWCYGAPGIGLARLRAYQVTKKGIYKEEAINACEGTVLSFGTGSGNYSLCHGDFGNCETLLEASKVLNDQRYYDYSLAIAEKGLSESSEKGVNWKCGTLGGIPDPSLMVGESGIGYFLLRLYDEQIPSLLCITSDYKDQLKSTVAKTVSHLQRDYINAFWGNTLRYLNSIAIEDDFILKTLEYNIEDTKTDIEKAADSIQNFINSYKGEEKEKMEEIFSIERIRLQSTKLIKDYTEGYLRALTIRNAEEITWENSVFEINYNVNLLEHKYDWAWLIDSKQECDNEEGEYYYVTYPAGNRINVFKISALTYIILKSCNGPSTVGEIAEQIKKYIFVDSSQLLSLNKTIQDQLYEAYKSGLLRLEIKHSDNSDYMTLNKQ